MAGYMFIHLNNMKNTKIIPINDELIFFKSFYSMKNILYI
jgi:hypothetical protein